MKLPQLALLVGLLHLAICALHAADIYVATSGNDTTGTGAVGAPFRTIQKAANVAVAGDNVLIRAGTYRESVTPPTNGSSGAPITFKNYPGETPVISGADVLTSWTSVGNGVFRAPMSWNYNYELVSDTSFSSNQVFLDGRMLTLLRWPKETNLDPVANPRDALIDSSSVNNSNVIATDAEFTEPPARWVGAKVWINLARLGLDGQGQTGIVAAASTGQITFSNVETRTGPQAWGVGTDTRYYLFNPTAAALAATGGPAAALDPGEWWYDSAAQQMYVRTWDGSPPAEIVGDPRTVEARRRSWAFSLHNRAWITLRGLHLFSSSIRTDTDSANRTNTIAPANNILLDALNVRYATHFTDLTGNYQMQWISKSGLILSGSAITLQNSVLRFSAGSGISVLGQNNKILNNVLSDLNYANTEAGMLNTGKPYDTPGNVAQTSLDHEIAYNTLYRTPQQGINFRSLKNSTNSPATPLARIHHNVIHDVMLQSFDSAAIDSFGTNHQHVRIDHNVIFNLPGPLNFGIYFDYASAGIVDHNLLFDVREPLNINWEDSATAQNMRLFNNTALQDSTDVPPVYSIGNHSPGSIIRNNLLLNTLPQSFPTATLSNNVIAQPAFFTAPGLADYTLVASALAAIDQGVSVAPFDDPISGPAPDVGAFERGLPAWTAGSSLIAPQPTPGGLSATQIDSRTVRLDWTDRSSDETHIIIMRSPDNGHYWTQIGRVAANTTTFTDTQIPGGRYLYAVRGDRSPLSSRANARGGSVQTLFYPGTFDAQSGSINVFGNSQIGGTSPGSWIRFNALDFGAAGSVTTFTAYYASYNASAQIQVRLGNPVTGTLIATLTAGTSDATYRNLSGPVSASASGTHDVYLVFTGWGTANMDTFRFIGNAPSQPSAAPAALSAAWAGNAVQLTWTDPSTNEQEFRIERALNNGPFTQLVRLPANTTAVTDTTVITSQRYRYRVSAANLHSPSAFSAPAEVTTPAPVPTGVQTFRTIYGLATNGSQDHLTPANDGVQNLLKYALNMLGSGTGQVTSLATPNASILAPAGTAGLPLVGVESGTGKLQLTYIRRKASASPAPGITYVVEFSDALTTWAVNPSASESVTSLDSTFERVIASDSGAFTTKRFARIKITAN